MVNKGLINVWIFNLVSYIRLPPAHESAGLIMTAYLTAYSTTDTILAPAKEVREGSFISFATVKL